MAITDYVILNENKEPKHGFKNGGKPWSEVKNEPNLAAIVPKGYVVLDFDTESDAKIIKAIVNGLDLKVRVMQTTRGVHVWFKMPEGEPLKNGIKQRLAIGIYSDRKSGGRNAYVKIRDNGKDRPWIKATPYEDLIQLPRWLRPIAGIKDNGFDFKALGEGDGRNQKLFNYIVYLQSKGFNRAEIREAIRVINDYVFAQPLPDDEMDKILRDESFKPDEVIQAEQAEKAKATAFAHNVFADEIIQQYSVITYNNRFYVYDGYYKLNDNDIENAMVGMFSGIKQKQRAEVLSYMKIKTHVSPKDVRINPYVVNINSGRFDLRKRTLTEHTPEAIEFDRVPVVYDPDAYCEALDKVLDKVFCHDVEVRALFEEMVGYCLVKHARFQKAFMFFGKGANGKSTILDLLKTFLGAGNYVSMDLDQLVKRRFNIAELENKLANIGDDISGRDLRDTDTLKKLFAGNELQVERKGETPFQLSPYATHIFSCNALPTAISDTSYGFYRRWCLIPLNARFTQQDEDYDSNIADKITTPEAMSYLFNLAVDGVQRLIENDGFTEPACVAAALETYKVDNSPTLSWIEDAGITIEIITTTSANELYSNVCDWCKLSGVKEIPTRQKFYKELREYFGLEDKPRQVTGGKRIFRVRLDGGEDE